jgi:hypothetical protein
MWIEILRREVMAKGPKQVAAELGVSRATVDLLCSGKYPADTRKMQEKIKAIYGTKGGIECPVLGAITPLKCAETWRRAKVIGMKAGNPETLKLYKACMCCGVRG